MKIFIICSKRFYCHIPEVKKELEELGHEVTLPNCFDNPQTEAQYRGTKEHSTWKAAMIRQSEKVISQVDAVLVLNFSEEKFGTSTTHTPYIGGATFLEMYDAFRLNRRIYMLYSPPDNIIKDEIIGFAPIIIGRNFEMIK